MKNKRILLLTITILFAAALSGCQLAKPDKALNDSSAKPDILVGVFITDHILEFEITESRLVTVSDTDNDGNVIEMKRWRFDDEGILFAHPTMPADGDSMEYSYTECDGIADCTTHYGVSDDDINTSLTGTLYLKENSDDIIYLNEVYQRYDGSLYAVANTGFSTGSAGFSNISLSESAQKSENGKESTVTATIEVNLVNISEPESISVLEMADGGKLLNTKEYAPNEIPDNYVVSEECKYIIIETQDKKGVTTQSLITAEDDNYCVATYSDKIFCNIDYINFEWCADN